MVYDKTIPQTGVCRIILALCIALVCVLLDSEGPSVVFISRQLRHIPSWRRHEACHMLQVFEQFIAENAKFSAQQNLRRKAQMVAMMKLSNFDAYFAAALASINPEGQSPGEMGVVRRGANRTRIPATPFRASPDMAAAA